MPMCSDVHFIDECGVVLLYATYFHHLSISTFAHQLSLFLMAYLIWEFIVNLVAQNIAWMMHPLVSITFVYPSAQANEDVWTCCAFIVSIEKEVNLVFVCDADIFLIGWYTAWVPGARDRSGWGGITVLAILSCYYMQNGSLNLLQFLCYEVAVHRFMFWHKFHYGSSGNSLLVSIGVMLCTSNPPSSFLTLVGNVCSTEIMLFLLLG